MTAPPPDAFAAAARQAIDVHDEWDAPHCFQTLHWNGAKLITVTYACIMTDIPPDDYPDVMAGIALKELAECPDDTACGYLLQFEGFGVVELSPEASAAQREQLDQSRRERTLHTRPDAVESCIALVTDTRGRLWTAMKARNEPGRVQEDFYPLGAAPGGRMATGLLAVGLAAGEIARKMGKDAASSPARVPVPRRPVP